ncbi:MAG: B12-binding domain-containing protein [Chloroflexi bacterium]|nr:B12-binding domain-containing protein [Chloroflexota bacterium]
MSISKSPTFNLKVVLNETGLPADTLRAWERRYGLPLPQRTAGGHRLYSQFDIETIRWLLARQAEGLSISHAVDMWNEQLASGSDPLAGAASSALTVARAGAPTSSLEAMRSDWLSACLKYETSHAEQILNQAFAANSVEVACVEIVMRGMSEIGGLWHQGKATVQQEHFTSEIATRKLQALISATPPPARNEAILLACPPNEGHAFPLLLLTLFLRRRGWNAIHLGANVPIDQIEETLAVTKSKLVILAAQTLVNAVSLREMARALNKKGIASAFGGSVFNSISGLQARIPAHFLGNTIEQSLPVIEELVVNPRPTPAEERVKKSLLQMSSAFQTARHQIEAALTDAIETRVRPAEYIDFANRFLGDSLIAALELGDISHLSTDIMWISNLLTSHQISAAMLPAYLTAYAQSVDMVMKDEGKEISDWLKLESAGLKT